MDKEPIRRLSRALFGGAQYRVEVGAAIREGDVVTISTLAEQLGDPPGRASVNVELKVLEAVGLLVRLPRVPADRHVYLAAVASAYWDTCREFVAAAQPSREPGGAHHQGRTSRRRRGSLEQ